MDFLFKKIEKNEVTESQIKDIVSIEGEDGYTEDQIRNIWQDEKIVNDNFACLLNDEIIGSVSFNPNSKRRNGSVFMVNLSVSPKYRRMGIAQNLIYIGCKYYKKNNLTKPMSTSVDKDNNKAINLYQKIGYEIKEPICEIDIDDEQYVMEADLSKLLNNLKNILLKKNAELEK